MPDQRASAHILLVDDEDTIRRILARELENLGDRVDTCADAAAARAFLKATTPDAIILDVRLPGTRGDEFIAEASVLAPGVPVIMLTGHANVDLAVDCMRKGAADLLTKPCSVDHLHMAVHRAIEGGKLVETTRQLTRNIRAQRPVPAVHGSSPPMQRLARLVERVAPTDDPVLVVGESGTGKELVAAAIQRQSRRAAAPFVTVNCAAVAETLLESELFGHEKGAFSGAEERRLGFFEIAEGGTIFLDEIGDMPLSMQPKLLRVLQSGEFRRVGGNKTLFADVRVLAATNMSLPDAVREGRFREDLMHRINTFTIEMPPLRDRLEDIDELVGLFLRELGGRQPRFGPEAMALLRAYPWPGNVRELRNVVRRAAVLADGAEIEPCDLPSHMIAGRDPGPAAGSPSFDPSLSLSQVEKNHVLAMLAECGGNKTQAARRLGVAVKTLYNKLEAWQDSSPDDD